MYYLFMPEKYTTILLCNVMSIRTLFADKSSFYKMGNCWTNQL